MMRRKMKNECGIWKEQAIWEAYRRNHGYDGKMEKMKLAFCKAQGMDDYLYNMGGMSLKASIALPPKFKISDVENFDGLEIQSNMWRDT